MNKYNLTWIAFANKKRCRHADYKYFRVFFLEKGLMLYYSILTIPANCTK